MKKTNQLPFTMKKEILCLALFAGALGGCTKTDAPKNRVMTASRHKYQPTLTTMAATLRTFEPNTMDWRDLGIGYNDENTSYNKAKLFLSVGLAEVVKDPVIAEWIVNQAKVHEDNVFYFEDLFAEFPETKQIIESRVDPLGEMTGWSFEQIQEHMKYEDYDIKASIYLTNTDIADISQKPMVTPGYDIMQEDEKHPSDVVLGWYIDNNNNTSRINLWKEVIDGVTAPIFAIDGRATNKLPIDIVTPPYPSQSDTPRTANKFEPSTIILSQMQFGQRYENSGNSEFKLTGKCLFFPIAATMVAPLSPNPNAYARHFLRPHCQANYFSDDAMDEISVSSNLITSWTPINVSKYFARITGSINDLNDGERDIYYTTTNPPSSPTYNNMSRKKLYYNTYENDGWPTSNKPLSPASINGVQLALKGHMGTYSEWYQYDPNNPVYWTPANTFNIDFYDGNTWERTRWSVPAKGGWTKFTRVSGCQ